MGKQFYNFTPGRGDGGLWVTKGVQWAGNLYIDGKLLTFEQICKYEYGLPKKHFFKHLQLKHFISSKNKDLMSEPPPTNLKNLIITNVTTRGIVSLFYGTLVSDEQESSNDRIEAWKLEKIYMKKTVK